MAAGGPALAAPRPLARGRGSPGVLGAHQPGPRARGAPRTVRPHAPAGQPSAHGRPGGVRYGNGDMDLDPEPLPNLVLHPGDALAVAPDPHDATAGVVHLYDRHGHRFAVLDCDRAGSDRFTVVAIRLVSAPGGGGGPPLRPQPEPVAHPLPDSYALPDVPAGTAPGALVHAHRHPHHGRLDVIARTGLVVDRYDHSHRHAHTTPRDDRSYHDDHEH